jgi:DNA mismatch endonuclease, patch repair protein
MMSKRTNRLQTTRPKASTPAVRRRMQVTLRRDTPGELALRSAIHRSGLRFHVDWPIPGTRRRADLAFVSAKVVVFVDGCFWHGCPKHATWPKANAAWWRVKIQTNVRRDRDTDARLRAGRWKVLRFWEHESNDRAALSVVRAVNSSRARQQKAAPERRLR